MIRRSGIFLVLQVAEIKPRKLIVAAVMMTTALVSPAGVGQRMEERKERQKERIQEGRKSGELMKKEAARIRTRERNLNRQVREDRKDGGGMTPAERAKIEKRQDDISQDIYKQKHNAQKTAPK
jgi:tellurite resistance protein